MKAAVYANGGPHKWWTFRDNFPPVSSVPPGKVLVRVMAVSLNPLDYKLPKLPFVSRLVRGKPIGEDFAGVVLNTQCSAFGVGDEVYGFGDPMFSASGTLCEFLIADPTRIAHKPKNLSFVEAAAMPLAAVTSLQCLRDYAGAGTGTRLLLIGASGGTGSFAVQIAKALGAHVTAVCSGKNEAFVRKLGADEVHDYNSASAVPLNAGPFDAVYDMVSSPDAGDHCYEPDARPLLRSAGKYIAINGSPLDFLRSIISGRIGINLQRRDFAIVEYKQRGSDLAVLAGLCEQGKLRPAVARELPFTEAGIAEAFLELRSRRLRGKVVLAVGEPAQTVTHSRL